MRTLLLSAVVSLTALPSHAGLPAPFNSGGQLMWDLATQGYPENNKIPYLINPSRPSGSPILPNGTTDDEIVLTIRNAFQAFENIPTSSLSFEYRGIDRSAGHAEDGIMVISLDYEALADPCSWVCHKVPRLAPVVGEYQLPSGGLIQIERRFSLIDYDMTLCGVTYSIDGSEGWNLSRTVAHELGHLLGLGHSIVQPALMHGYTSAAPLGLNIVASDDRIGLSTIYPSESFFRDTGTIAGKIEQADSDGNVRGEVFGAHITVIDALTGNVVTDSISGVTETHPETHRAISWDAEKNSGRFVVSGLPPGNYHLRVDAYDGPRRVPSTGRIINAQFFTTDGVGPRRDFGYIRDDSTIRVVAGTVTDLGSIQVGPHDPLFPNLDASAFVLTESGFVVPALGLVGDTVTVAVASGENVSPDDEYFIDGNTYCNVSNPRWLASNRTDFVLLDVSIDPNCPPGNYSIGVSNEHGFSLVHGALLVSTGAPVIESAEIVLESSNDTISVRGRHFTPESHVLVDGLLGRTEYVDTGLIRVTPVDEISSEIEITVISNTGTDSFRIEHDQAHNLVITSAFADNFPTIRWTSEQGEIYTVERSRDLVNWEVVGNIDGSPDELSEFTDTTSEITGQIGVYYRIRYQ